MNGALIDVLNRALCPAGFSVEVFTKSVGNEQYLLRDVRQQNGHQIDTIAPDIETIILRIGQVPIVLKKESPARK